MALLVLGVLAWMFWPRYRRVPQVNRGEYRTPAEREGDRILARMEEQWRANAADPDYVSPSTVAYYARLIVDSARIDGDRVTWLNDCVTVRAWDERVRRKALASAFEQLGVDPASAYRRDDTCTIHARKVSP